MTPHAEPAGRSRLRAEAERRLSPTEVEAYLSVTASDAEREGVLSQVGWFRRRYPTGADRLAYVRRAYRRWTSLAWQSGHRGVRTPVLSSRPRT